MEKEPVSFYMDKEEKRLLWQIAKRESRTLTGQINFLIKEFLDRPTGGHHEHRTVLSARGKAGA